MTSRGAAVLACCLAAASACRSRGSPEVELNSARQALQQDRPREALEHYRAALDALERDTRPTAALYRARALRGAADLYAFHLDDAPRAVEVYRELIRVAPDGAETLEARVHLAHLLRHRFKDARAAIAELTAALARNPPDSAELTYEVGTMYFELQDYRQCVLEAEGLLRRFEASAFVDDATYLRAQALSMMEGRRLEAQRGFMDVVDRFPDSELKPHALFELGRLKNEAGEAERAIELWVESLKSHPAPAMVQAAIARARSRLKNTTPQSVGDAAKAFDWGVPGANMGPGRTPARTSAEAVGLSPEEAAREENMPVEQGQAAPPQEAPASTE